jgi:general stress protein 13
MIKPGSIVYGKITNILGYGAFVAIEGYDGLIHISEFSDNFVRNIEDYVKVGDRIKLKVLEVDEEHKQLKLSYRQLHKTRGVRCRVPQYQIGFQPLKENLNHWIEVSKEGKDE